MNRAVAHLSASLISASTQISQPQRSRMCESSFYQCHLRGSSQSFFFSSSSNFQISLHSSSFSKFLNSAIVLSSTSMVRKQLTSSQSLGSQTYLTIYRCCFTSCSSSTNGGAVYVTSGSVVTISYSYFLSCSATSRGGAICLQQTNVSISSSTFCKCSVSSGNYGSASSLNPSSLQFANEKSITVYLCPSVLDTASWHAFNDCGGNHIHRNLNFSFGYLQNLAGPQHYQLTYCESKFVSTSSNLGVSLGFQGFSCSGDISYWNVINNSKNYVMRIISSTVNMSFFTFQGNNAPLFGDSSGVLNLCNCAFYESSISAVSGTLVTVGCSFGVLSLTTNSVSVASQFYSNDCVLTEFFSFKSALSSRVLLGFFFVLGLQ